MSAYVFFTVDRRYVSFIGAALLLVGGGVLLHESGASAHWMRWAHRQAWIGSEVWLTLTFWGDLSPLLLLGVWLARQDPARRSLLLKLLLVGVVLTQLPKYGLNLPRPQSVLEPGVLQILGHPPGFVHSMPSGHALAVASVLAWMCWVCWMKGRPAVSWWRICLAAGVALWVGWSRVAVGAHWPADVLVGWGLGLLTLVLALWWERRQSWAKSLSTRAGRWFWMVVPLLPAADLAVKHVDGQVASVLARVLVSLVMAGGVWHLARAAAVGQWRS